MGRVSPGSEVISPAESVNPLCMYPLFDYVLDYQSFTFVVDVLSESTLWLMSSVPLMYVCP